MLNARPMSDCSSCTPTPCLATVADIVKTCMHLVAAWNNGIRPLPQPYTLPWAPLRWLYSVSSTERDAYHVIRPQKSQSWQHHDVWFRRLCGQMPLSTIEVSSSWQEYIGHVGVNVHQRYIVWLIDCRLPLYAYTYIQQHNASWSFRFQSYAQFFKVYSGLYFWCLHGQCRSGLTGVCVYAVCQWEMYLR